MTEKLWLRCTNCNYVFVATIDSNDKIYEMGCPKCNKKYVELDLGHKIAQDKVWNFRYDTKERIPDDRTNSRNR